MDSASIIYKDETIVGLEEFSISGYQDTSSLHLRGNIIEIEKVQSVTINDEIISIMKE